MKPKHSRQGHGQSGQHNSLLWKDAFMGLGTTHIESPNAVSNLPMTWAAPPGAGGLVPGIAFVIIHYLLHEFGLTRGTVVSYLLPLGGVMPGIVFLNKELSWQLAMGTLLISASILVVNWKTK